MNFILQFGHGMMEHCRHLINQWENGTVIFSPRDMTERQIDTLSTDIQKLGGNTLLDPQFYDPHGDHHGLVKHDYWPENFNTSVFLSGPQLTTLIEKIVQLNTLAKTNKVLLPGLYCERVDDDWLSVQESIINESKNIIEDKPILATVCISGEALRFEDQIEMLLNASEEWDVDGYYLVPEHPNGTYLADDPIWLTNLLTLSSGFKIQGREVLVGYSNHQMLCLSCAKVDAIAAGTWLNVRSFSTTKFQEPESDSISRRVKWYYCPQTMSEYKLPFLDMAFTRGVLDSFASPPECNSNYADVLFGGAQPSTTSYNEQQSFRHYLSCLRSQCIMSSNGSFQETINYHQKNLDDVERMIREAHRAGVRGQDRDFANIIDVNRVAIQALVDTRGFILERLW